MSKNAKIVFEKKGFISLFAAINWVKRNLNKSTLYLITF